MRKKAQYKITFSNKGIVIVDSFDRREGGVYWQKETIQGYSSNDLIKSIEEIEDGQGTQKV
jgi:hypothetical protein